MSKIFCLGCAYRKKVWRDGHKVQYCTKFHVESLYDRKKWCNGRFKEEG